MRSLHTCLQCIKCSVSTKLTPNDDQDHENCLNSEHIFAYILQLHGVLQDDWSWDSINTSLDPDSIKFVHLCSQLDQSGKLSQLGKNIGYSLKVFLSIIVMEGKFQAQILYFLKAVMKHLS